MMVSIPSSFSTKFIRSALWMSPFTNCAPGQSTQPALQIALVPAHAKTRTGVQTLNSLTKPSRDPRTLKLDLSFTLCKFLSDEQ